MSLIFFAFIGLGFSSSLFFVLGYVWVDIFTPQKLAYSILPSIPVSLVMAILVITSFFFLEKNKSIKLRSQTMLTALLAVWMTISLAWAVAPDSAFAKWDWAFKSLVFSCFVPFFLRSRIHIEAFLWTILLSGMGHCLAFAPKVLLSGGGYGMALGLVASNAGFGEGSTLALFAVCLIPVCMYLYKHQTLIPYPRLTRLILAGFMVAAVLTALGTFARTGLVSLFALGGFLFFSLKEKVKVLFLFSLAATLIFYTVGDDWLYRMGTINDGTESSAMGRVAVWKWTIEYVAIHPWGGSFDMYRINRYEMPLADGSFLSINGKAFHSIYFEMLGEGGVPGLALFGSIVYFTRKQCLAIRVCADGNGWLPSLGRNILLSMYVYLVGGAFVGIVFQPFLYYLVALSAAAFNVSLMTRKV